MTDSSKENSPNPDWPKEVKEAYEHLKIPSLYDAVLANEKLSFEMRRQDHDFKSMSEHMRQLSSQLNHILEILEEEEEEYELEESLVKTTQEGIEEDDDDTLTNLEMELLEENQQYLQQQSQDILMSTHDDVWELCYTARRLMLQTLTLLPKKEGIIPHEPVWHSVVEGILQNLIESIEKCRYQLLARLKEMQIDLINPQPGDALNPALHRAVDHQTGGKVGTIARVVRVGYSQNQEVLRLADVTIYQ